MTDPDVRHYRMRRGPALGMAAALAVMALGGLFLGEFGSADTRYSPATWLLDLASLPLQMTLAYGFLILLLILAILIAVRALSSKPALTITPEGVTLRTVFATKSIRWDEVENFQAAGEGMVVLSGRSKTVTVAPQALVAPEGEILTAIQAARAGRRARAPRRPRISIAVHDHIIVGKEGCVEGTKIDLGSLRKSRRHDTKERLSNLCLLRSIHRLRRADQGQQQSQDDSITVADGAIENPAFQEFECGGELQSAKRTDGFAIGLCRLQFESRGLPSQPGFERAQGDVGRIVVADEGREMKDIDGRVHASHTGKPLGSGDGVDLECRGRTIGFGEDGCGRTVEHQLPVPCPEERLPEVAFGKIDDCEVGRILLQKRFERHAVGEGELVFEP
jgi:hypothetical protein